MCGANVKGKSYLANQTIFSLWLTKSRSYHNAKWSIRAYLEI